jgi:hypothetical protein
VTKDKPASAIETIALLNRLRGDGALTEGEFDNLKQQLLDDSGSQIPFTDTNKPADKSTASGFAALLIAAIGLTVVDHFKGGIFPDDFYCVVGAGTAYSVPARTEATGWSANNGCGVGRPECATRWIQYPAGSKCAHGTLLDAIRK